MAHLDDDLNDEVLQKVLKESEEEYRSTLKRNSHLRNSYLNYNGDDFSSNSMMGFSDSKGAVNNDPQPSSSNSRAEPPRAPDRRSILGSNSDLARPMVQEVESDFLDESEAFLTNPGHPRRGLSIASSAGGGSSISANALAEPADVCLSVPLIARQEISLLDGKTGVEFVERALKPATLSVRNQQLKSRGKIDPEVDVLPPLALMRPLCLISNIPLIQCKTSAAFCYFEVTIIAAHDSAAICVGLATHPFPEQTLPGFSPVSVSFVSDGTRCHCDDDSVTCSPFQEQGFGAGDVVGCGYIPAVGGVFFTLNGQYLGEAYSLATPDVDEDSGSISGIPFHAAVGADAYCVVNCNFGTAPYAYSPADESAASALARKRSSKKKFSKVINSPHLYPQSAGIMPGLAPLGLPPADPTRLSPTRQLVQSSSPLPSPEPQPQRPQLIPPSRQTNSQRSLSPLPTPVPQLSPPARQPPSPQHQPSTSPLLPSSGPVSPAQMATSTSPQAPFHYQSSNYQSIPGSNGAPPLPPPKEGESVSKEPLKPPPRRALPQNHAEHMAAVLSSAGYSGPIGTSMGTTTSPTLTKRTSTPVISTFITGPDSTTSQVVNSPTASASSLHPDLNVSPSLGPSLSADGRKVPPNLRPRTSSVTPAAQATATTQTLPSVAAESPQTTPPHSTVPSLSRQSPHMALQHGFAKMRAALNMSKSVGDLRGAAAGQTASLDRPKMFQPSVAGIAAESKPAAPTPVASVESSNKPAPAPGTNDIELKKQLMDDLLAGFRNNEMLMGDGDGSVQAVNTELIAGTSMRRGESMGRSRALSNDARAKMMGLRRGDVGKQINLVDPPSAQVGTVGIVGSVFKGKGALIT